MPNFFKRYPHLLKVEQNLLEDEVEKKPAFQRQITSGNNPNIMISESTDLDLPTRKKSVSLYEKNSHSDESFDPNGILSDIKRSHTQMMQGFENSPKNEEEESQRMMKKEAEELLYIKKNYYTI